MDEVKTTPVLTDTDRARFDAASSSIRALGNEAQDGSITEESIEATFNQLGHLELDVPRILNSLHVPKHAGVYAGALVAVLKRIPDGWGRWISCDPGWYPIIVELDAALVALDPDYEVQQVKEKYGTLRYYCEPAPCGEAECDKQFMADRPRPGSTDDPDFQAWADLWDAHCDTPEHEAGFTAVHDPCTAHRDEMWPKFDALVRAAEKKSAKTCERCGHPGSIRGRRGWVKTLCDDCASVGGWQA